MLSNKALNRLEAEMSDPVRMLRGYCLFRIACALIAMAWFVQMKHYFLAAIAAEVAFANFRLRRLTIRAIRDELEDQRPRPLLVLEAKTAFLWLLIALLVWWQGW